MAIIKDLYSQESKRNNQKFIYKNFDEYFRSTSLSGEFGRIFCLAYAVNDFKPEVLSGDESEILTAFWKIASDVDLFVGHNIMDFDLRFIYKRSVILSVVPSVDLNFARYRSSPIFDTMKEWEKWSNYSISLHKLSLALGLSSPKDQGIDGSKVYDNFLAGNGDKIIEYCLRDVEAVRKVYKKICFCN